jgi:hypothetical protein
VTIVIGQIESLKSIKEELQQKGVSKFSSVGEINSFINSYDSTIQNLTSQIKTDFYTELDGLESEIVKLKSEYDQQKDDATAMLTEKIEKLKSRCELLKSSKKNTMTQIVDSFELAVLKSKVSRLEKNFDIDLLAKTCTVAELLKEKKDKLIENTINKERIISNRISSKTRELAHAKEVVDDLYPLIAGAIGENLVVKELQNLSDKNTLFNDYSLSFKRPIYNRKEDDTIFSIQLDHLLVTNSGLFVIETKNWSKESIENFDLRSPVQQIRRASFALFVLLNSDSNQSYRLRGHHWGERQIPIRNLVLMIKHKPKGKFKHVAVKTLKELNRYVNYFEPIFDDIEVRGIVDYLKLLKEQNDLETNTLAGLRRSGKTRDYSLSKSSRPNIHEWLKNNPGKGVND